jgi:hypothetical protein
MNINNISSPIFKYALKLFLGTSKITKLAEI